MNILSAGDLIPDGEFQLHSKFYDVVNFTCGDLLVSVVNKRIGEGPLNILVSDDDLLNINSIRKFENTIFINNKEHKLLPDQFYSSTFELSNGNIQIDESLELLGELLSDKSHPNGLAFLIDQSRSINFTKPLELAFVRHMTKACNLVVARKTTEGLKKMKGCGFGLTPSGDDFISGFLIGLNFKFKLSGSTDNQLLNDILNVAKSRNPFSNTFLKLSHGGHMLPRVKNLLLAIQRNNQASIVTIFNEFLKHGETSGSDFLVGLFFSLNGEANENIREN